MFADVFFTELVDTSSGTNLNDGGVFNSEESFTVRTTINSAIVNNCCADHLYVIRNTDQDLNSWSGDIPGEWSWDTTMDAKFNGNLEAGSLEFSVDTTKEIKLKRRRLGEQSWKTIFIKPINDVDDFNFDFFDKYVSSNTVYEYVIIPVTRLKDEETGEYLEEYVEGRLEEDSIYSTKVKFKDYFILDKDHNYHVIMNSKNTPTYNQEGSMQTTIGRKHPYIIQNGNVAYYSGSFEGTFVRLTPDCEFDLDGGAAYRREVDQFLTSGTIKIIKDFLGNMYMVSIFEPVQQQTDDFVYTPVHTINWVECGDANSIGDLYDNGFIDIDMDRDW